MDFTADVTGYPMVVATLRESADPVVSISECLPLHASGTTAPRILGIVSAGELAGVGETEAGVAGGAFDQR